MYRVSMKVKSGSREWVQQIRYIDEPTTDKAKRHARRIVKKWFPSSRVRFRGAWQMKG